MPDVQIAVRTEREVAAVVVRERLRDEALAAPATQIEARPGSATSGLPATAGTARRQCGRRFVKLTKNRPLAA